MSSWLKRDIPVHILRFADLSVGWQVMHASPRSKALKADGSELLQAYIPLHFKAGDALQFDWSEEHVVLGGVEQKIKVAHFRLCHSRKPFIVAYPGES